MDLERASGILLHPTSLPGPYGIGDIGPQAHGWIDFLAESGTRWWQILPLGPTGYGDSPYQSFSAFAGNPYLISPEFLLQDGLLTGDDLLDAPDFPDQEADYGAVIPWKLDLLDRAYTQFKGGDFPNLEKAFSTFQEQAAGWLGDYALFMAIKQSQGGKPWVEWPVGLKSEPSAPASNLKDFAEKNREILEKIKFRQFLFHRQWDHLRDHARQRGVRIMGDIPIFVAHDSADVWANRELFYLDEEGQPTVVAGVPPDYFSETGQLWGNPLYKWDVHARDDYRWWMARLEQVLSRVDLVRLDHFRGFAGYWAIPAGAETAVDGKWQDGPGADFLRTVQDTFGELPVIAEDLGEITPDVVELRDRFNLPGMKVLVFAFDSGPENEFLPYNYTRDYVVYTGTHDNDTARGWFERADDEERQFALDYLDSDGKDMARDLVRAAWSSVATIAIAPLQDLLGLGNEARMNYPSRPGGNWTWRMAQDALSKDLRNWLKKMNQIYSRTN